MIKLSVKKPFTIFVAVVMVLVLGVVSLTGMTADLLPDVSLPYIIVVTTYPGASPERVENDVVRPLEGALGTVKGVKNVSSTSSENFGLVQLEFSDGIDMDSTLVKISSAIQETAPILPDGCGTPSIIELSMDMMATMYVAVSREGYDIHQLSGFVSDTVQPFIERQNGVANVTTIGLIEQYIQVELDNDKIQQLTAALMGGMMPPGTGEGSTGSFVNPIEKMLTLDTLSNLIYAQNFSMPAGYIDDANDNSWLLKIGEELKTVEDIENILLMDLGMMGQIRIGDVANVTLIDNSGESYSRHNGEQAIILSIFKDSVTGTNETSKACLAAFSELTDKYEGMHVVTLMNQGSYIDIIINSILTSILIGAGLAIIILSLFLKSVKPTIIVAISIPLSVLFTLVLMYFTDLSLNMMTLSGIALGIGMLVDNSVVVIENIFRLRSRGVSAPRAAVQGAKQVAGAIISSTLTTICVFLPLVFTSGLVRELLLPLGLCIGYCLTASLLVALTVVPAAASTLLKNAKPKAHPWFDKFLNVYGKFLNWCLNKKWIPLTATIALLAVCVMAVFQTGIVLIPDMTGNQIQVSVVTPEGLSREESYAEADKIIDELLKIDGVDDIGVMDSGSASGMLGGLMNMASSTDYGKYVFYIALPDKTSTTTINEITGKINEIDKIFDSTIDASAGGLGDMTTLLASGLSVNIYGDDIETMNVLSDKIIKIVETVKGYQEITSSFTDGDPTIHLIIDKDKAMAKGLTVAQVYLAVSERMSTSKDAANVTLNGVNMSVTVENNRDPLTVENLLDLKIETTTTSLTGATTTGYCTLSEIASIEQTTAIGAITRENLSRYVSVKATVAEGYNATLLARDLSTKLDEFVKSGEVPYGYSVELEGESTMVNDMVQQMLLLILLGGLFIYLVMVAQFQSLRSPFIVLFTVPLAFTGGMLGLLITGHQLSLLSLMGFAVLMGTVVNNGIVFVDYVNQLRIGGMDRRSALIAAGKTRMRPILMTALTTILAMFQLIISDDMAGQLGSGMAIVIVGGLTYATLMTLVIVPVMYDIFFKREPKVVDIGNDNLDDVPDDAAEFIAQAKAQEQLKEANG